MRQMIPKARSGRVALSVAGVFLLVLAVAATPVAAQKKTPTPKFSEAKAFDVSPPLYDVAMAAADRKAPAALSGEPIEIRPEVGPVVKDTGFAGDGALQRNRAGLRAVTAAATIAPPLLTFEGLANTDNPFLLAPPDPIGDVGPNHYVEMVNVVFSVYDKAGNQLIPPTELAALWEGFEVPDCAENSGDPIVVYDQFEDRWILSQFTTAGFSSPDPVFYNCVAISQTGDPTGPYYRYAFTSGDFFPDYPKYGVWNKSYLLTSRDFGYGPGGGYGIAVYALEKNKMLAGNPKARAVKFFLDSDVVPISLMGDGLLPADIDGHRRPRDHAPAVFVGTQDDGHPYGATFDALNVYELFIKWKANPEASFELVAQLPVDSFDSIFPCAPTSRDCIPQPDVTAPTRYLDVLSYRQRPMWRLAYRNFGEYESMVTNQAVEALPGLAGVRWYEIRRTDGVYTVHQQGTYAPPDGVHRWMGSVAMDWQGNMALGYSVSNGTDVYPGIRYTGRLAGDPPGQMTLGEATVIDGTGSQLTVGSRWGDYTSMNIDPTDDCTFWYVNQYIETTGLAFWQTRVAAFKLPGCVPRYD